MPNWIPLRSAILRDDPNARRLGLIHQIETWLGLPWEQALEACAKASPTLDQAREVNALLHVVLNALYRDLGIAELGPKGAARFEELAASYQAGNLDSERRCSWERANVAFGLWAAQRQHDPAVASPSPVASDDAPLRAALGELIDRQNEAQKYAVPGAATPDRMAALEAVVGDYRSLIAKARAGGQVHVDICFFAAHAAYALARGCWILGRVERAAQLYAEAAILYEQGDRPVDALQSRQKARELGYANKADIDGASLEDLRALVERDTEPLSRARAQARLSALAGAANDLFDAAEWAEKAIGNLVLAGFLDPEAQAAEEAEDALLNAWIGIACKDASTPGPLRLLLEVGDLYQSLLGVRLARWVGLDPARADRTAAALSTLNGSLLEVAAQPAAAHKEVMDGLMRYAPQLAPQAPDPVDDGLPQRLQALSDRINAIKVEANAAEEQNDRVALQALSVRSAACIQDARGLAMGPTIGLAYQTDAYVRLRAGDSAGASASAADGEAALLDGLPSTPELMAGYPQFDLLLMLRKVRMQALGMQADTAGLLALAEDSVRLIEARRYQVTDPYQQGAFLSERTFFYEMAVFASFRLENWDSLLSAMDLIKARAALLNRLSPPPTITNAELLARLETANAALATAAEGSEARLAATEQRRLVLSLLAIERRRAGTGDAVPTLSVAAVQAVLAHDEAVVAWVWVAAGVLIVLALDRSRFHAERVVLSQADRDLLDAYVELVRDGSATVRALDGIVTRLANAVLPLDTRNFVRDARRLILSPHRALHLLPFHAAVFDGRFLIEQSAIRYVPNLGSLLLPWSAPPAAHGTARMLALGINRFSVPGEDWLPLNSAEAEARLVADLWAKRGVGARLLLGDQATVAAFRALEPELQAYRCLHLATHGSSVFAKEAANDPFASRLILRDGALDALSIGQLRIGAEVVVLSACDSGQRALGGRGLAELPGDDVFGLQAALFEAGAHSVVGALWPVDDSVAPIIVSALHAGLSAGLAPEVALRDAMLGYLERPDARQRIYFWAPLFLSSLGSVVPEREDHRA
jgi:CHAT domain